MKTKHIFFVLTTLMLLGACKKGFLDQVPNNVFTLDEVFKRRTETEKYLANVYGYIRDEANQWNGNPWFGISDEGDVTYNRPSHPTYAMNIGAWDASSNYFNFWTHYYRGIRAATTFYQR